jgi:cysteinyl-tRNA synthetase
MSSGHARAYVAFDVVYRLLSCLLGYDVQYVRNFTDLDDKIIARALAEGVPPLEVASRFIKEFHKVPKGLLALQNLESVGCTCLLRQCSKTGGGEQFLCV